MNPKKRTEEVCVINCCGIIGRWIIYRVIKSVTILGASALGAEGKFSIHSTKSWSTRPGVPRGVSEFTVERERDLSRVRERRGSLPGEPIGRTKESRRAASAGLMNR